MFIFYILTSYAVANEHDNHGIYYPDMNNTSGLGFDDSEKPWYLKLNDIDNSCFCSGSNFLLKHYHCCETMPFSITVKVNNQKLLIRCKTNNKDELEDW
jgi:hypothetical protein